MSSGMQKRVELEMRGRSANAVKDLHLDNCRGSEVSGLNSDFIALETLSMINVGLHSLDKFPPLESLRKLDLSDNRISGNLEPLTPCPKMTHLSLSGNKIRDIDALVPLQKLECLKCVDLFNCEVTSCEDYRVKVFALLPQIQFLDGFDMQGLECEDDDEDISVELDGEDDDDDDDDEDDDEDEDDDVEGGEVVGLDYLVKDNIEQDEDDEEDFDPEVDEDDDDPGEVDEEDETEDEDDENVARGLKRKHEDEAE